MNKRQKKKAFKKQFGVNPPGGISINIAVRFTRHKKVVDALLERVKKVWEVFIDWVRKVTEALKSFIEKYKGITCKSNNNIHGGQVKSCTIVIGVKEADKRNGSSG